MNKKNNVFIILLLVVSLLSGCSIPLEEEEIQFIKEEEFIQYIKANDVGVTPKDIEDINIDDFIKTWYLTNENIKDRVLSNLLNDYLENNEWQDNEKFIEPYLAYELRKVDSSDEEYEEFVQHLTLAIEQNLWIINSTGRGSYSIILKDREYISYNVGQTKDLYLSTENNETGKLKVIEGNIERDEPARLDFGYFEFAMRNHSPHFYYSRCQKYILYFDKGTHLIEHFEIIKAFCNAE